MAENPYREVARKVLVDAKVLPPILPVERLFKHDQDLITVVAEAMQMTAEAAHAIHFDDPMPEIEVLGIVDRLLARLDKGKETR